MAKTLPPQKMIIQYTAGRKHGSSYPIQERKFAWEGGSVAHEQLNNHDIGFAQYVGEVSGHILPPDSAAAMFCWLQNIFLPHHWVTFAEYESAETDAVVEHHIK